MNAYLATNKLDDPPFGEITYQKRARFRLEHPIRSVGLFKRATVTLDEVPKLCRRPRRDAGVAFGRYKPSPSGCRLSNRQNKGMTVDNYRAVGRAIISVETADHRVTGPGLFAIDGRDSA